MKTHSILAICLTLVFLFSLAPPGHAAVTGRSSDVSLAGTEKLLSDSSGADTFVLLSTLWGTTQPLTAGITATGSTSWDFSGSSATFKTSTGANTFGGSAHNFSAVLQPTTNDAAALGTTALGFSDLHLATGAVINVANGNAVITHSSGIFTVSTGDFRVTTAGTNAASAVTVGGTQTLTNKTLTSPAISGPTLSGSATGTYTLAGTPTITSPTISGPTLSGSVTGTYTLAGTPTITSPAISGPTLSGSVIGTYTLAGTPTITSPTITGPTITGTTATSGVITQTSASETALETGPNGGTNPVFRTVNNVSSAATGISITGRAAAAGADITVLSSGTNENLVINAKGSGTITLNPTGTGAVRSATGFLSKDLTESVTATNVITAAESGSVFFLNSATEFVSTLPAPAAGLHFTFIVVAAPSGASYTVTTNASSNIIKGMQLTSADAAGDTGTSDDTVSFVDGQAVAGDMIEVWSDGTSWFIVAKSRVAAGITFTTAS